MATPLQVRLQRRLRYYAAQAVRSVSREQIRDAHDRAQQVEQQLRQLTDKTADQHA